MDKNKELLVRHFIGLQGYALNNTRPGISYNDCDWETLISLGWMNKCGALLNNAVNKDPEYFNVEKSLMDKWNRMVKTGGYELLTKELGFGYNEADSKKNAQNICK